jgi:hypothetical protein
MNRTGKVDGSFKRVKARKQADEIVKEAPPLRAPARAASCGRRSSASAPLTRLDLSELGGDLEALGLGEAGDGRPLSVNAET